MAIKKSAFVTQPSLPPLEELVPYLEKIWESKIITNGGPFHKQLEDALCNYLGVAHISLFSNATIALLAALKALNITGEVITTPYSFVATSHALLWNNIKPVFVDIDPLTFNLNPKKINAAITRNTTAILPVHVYGTPCDVDSIGHIANQNGLKIIYDAAHAFGVKYHNTSLLSHGDLSVVSFHATKVFNTFEGGAIVSPNAETKLYIDRIKNFGFVDETMVDICGINGKMSEFNAALGLVQLKYIDELLRRRECISLDYRNGIKKVSGITIPDIPRNLISNYSYFPILVEEDYRLSRDGLYQVLKENKIFSRRYFYPLISEFSMYKELPSSQPDNLPVAVDIAKKVLCLPIYPDLDNLDVERIINIIAK